MNVTQLLNGLSLGSLYMILAAGLAMIYGLRGVLNLSHGALYMVGGYAGYQFAVTFGFWAALIVVPVLLAVIGAVLEAAVFRPLQERAHLVVALVTFGVALIIEHVIVLVWGPGTLPVSVPALLSGSTWLLGAQFPTYRLFIVLVSIGTLTALAVWLRQSRTGLYVRAASHDRETAAIIGVNVDRVSATVVCMGAAYAGLAGVLAGPYLSVQPGMGESILISSVIVVVVGGLGSIGGAMVAALALGLLEVSGAVLFPTISALIPFVALVLVIAFLPTGLAGKRVH